MILRYDPTEHVAWLDAPRNSTYPLRLVLKSCKGKWNGQHWMFPLDTKPLQQLQAELQFRGEHVAFDGVLQSVLQPQSGVVVAYPWTTKPRPYQDVGTSELLCDRRFMLNDEMGLGKTLQAIHAVNAAALPAVVVCPNSIKEQWKEEIAKHGSGNRYAPVIIPDGSTKVRAGMVSLWARSNQNGWLILNYEALRYFPQQFLDACKGSALIIDEAHRAKDGRTKQSKIIAAARPRALWLLTGTPIANRLEDVWHLANLVRPGILGWSFYQFDQAHIRRHYKGWVDGYKDVEEVTRVLSLISLRRLKEEVEPDLPPKIFERRMVDLSAEERKAYDKMKDEMVAWLDSNVGEGQLAVAQAKQFVTRHLRLRQIASGFVSEGVDGAQAFAKHPAKIEEAVQAWKDAGCPRVVIWCKWRPVIGAVYKALDAKVIRGYISGDVPTELRSQAIDCWRKSEGSVLICQMDTAGVGLNLQESSFEIFIDPPETPKQRLQCVDRCHRIGQQNPVTIVDIVARNTVDVSMYRTLEKKIEDAEFVMSFAGKKRAELEGML